MEEMLLFKEVQYTDVFVQTVFFVIKNGTIVSLAIKSEFNYSLIILEKILNNKFHFMLEHFLAKLVKCNKI